VDGGIIVAEECPRKAFNLISHLVVLGEELERGKDFADEASTQAGLAGIISHRLKEEGCIAEEKEHEISKELDEITHLTTLKKVGEAKDRYEPIMEKVEEADLREMARKWMEE